MFCEDCQSHSCPCVMQEEISFMDKEITDLKNKQEEVKGLLRSWIDKQGHDRCWYYPEIFMKLCEALEIKPTVLPCLPSLEEFKQGCERYQNEQFDSNQRPMG